MPNARLSIDDVNTMDHATFVRTLGFVFESSPWIADRAYAARPFANIAALHRALCTVMYESEAAEKEALISAHPDLAGKAAIAGNLTAESTREQASAGLDRLTPDEFNRFTRLNQAYRDSFGFPFIICVREHTRESILANFETRLRNDRTQEIETALGEIARIADLRLRDVVAG